MTVQEIQSIKQRFGIIGTNEALNHDIEIAVKVAQTDLSVLITGESGSGKEHFPQIIHAYSARKHGPYFAINCGAIPEGTIDSELFGHEKGAFTDARAERKGYFEIANGGTLFLDEVGELPMATQARLLRVLETGEFIRMGSSQVQKTNVRVVAATNLNMQRAIEDGHFRMDLYYRLNSVEIHVPALRERRDDIPVLFRKFAVDFAERYRMPASIRLNEEATRVLKEYDWSGNIRQLKHVAEQISILERDHDITAQTLRRYLPEQNAQAGVARAGGSGHKSWEQEREMILNMLFSLKQEVDHLKQTGGVATPTTSAPMSIPASLPSATISVPHEEEEEEIQVAEVVGSQQDAPITIEEMEKQSIKRALERNHGNRKAAAAELHLSERTLYRKIKEFEL